MKIPKYIQRLKSLRNPSLCYRIALGYMKWFIARYTGFHGSHFVLLALEETDVQSLIQGFKPSANVKIAQVHDFEDAAFVEEMGDYHCGLLKKRCGNSLYDCIVLTEPSKEGSLLRSEVKCYGCISYRKLEITSALQYQLNEKEAFFFDAYCLESARRKGYYKQVMNTRLQLCVDKGYTKVLTIVDTLNIPSMQAHKGWKREQTFYWFKFRGKEYSSLKHYSRL